MRLEKLKLYAKLMRLDKPVGTYLLLWPTLTALFVASQGQVQLSHFIVFFLGVFLMRSAGCIINDIADRNFDAHVSRTQDRVLANQKISLLEAFVLFIVILVFAFVLVCFTNLLTIKISILAAIVTILYPFMKRYFVCPQLVLGVAFGFGIPMSYATVLNTVPIEAFILYLGTLFHAIAYDTLYALVDKEDDLKIGIKSSAIWFGQYDAIWVFVFECLTWGCWLAYAMLALDANWILLLGMSSIAALILKQQYQITLGLKKEQTGNYNSQDTKDVYFIAFKANHTFSLLYLLTVILAFIFSA